METRTLEELRALPQVFNTLRKYYVWQDIPERFRVSLSPDDPNVPWRSISSGFAPAGAQIDTAPYVDLNVTTPGLAFGAELLPADDRFLKRKVYAKHDFSGLDYVLKVPGDNKTFRMSYFDGQMLYNNRFGLTLAHHSVEKEAVELFGAEPDMHQDVGVLNKGKFHRGLIGFKTRLDDTAIDFDRSYVEWKYSKVQEHFPERWTGYVRLPAFRDMKLDGVFRPSITLYRLYAHQEYYETVIKSRLPGFFKME